MNESTKILMSSILRHILSAGGAWLAAQGVIDLDSVGDYVETIVGAFVVIVTIFFSFRTKKDAIESPARSIQ